MYQPNYCFQIKLTYWQKDIKGLFDYKEKVSQFGKKRQRTLNTKNHCKLFRNNYHGQNLFSIVSINQTRNDAIFSYVGQLDVKKSEQGTSFWVRPHNSETTEDINTPYLVLNRKSENEAKNNLQYSLKIGDVIKLGRVKYTVIEMKTNDKVQTLDEKALSKIEGYYYKIPSSQVKWQNQGQLNEEISHKATKTKKIRKQKTIKQKQGLTKRAVMMDLAEPTIEESQSQCSILDQNKQEEASLSNLKNHPQQTSKQKPSCRICLCNEELDSNPLVSPCLCKGSCSYIHVQCLKQWVQSTTQLTVMNGVTQYKLNKSLCQICKHPFPSAFKFEDKQVSLYDFERPQASYIVLKGNDPQDEPIDRKNFLIIEGQNGRVTKIGRYIDQQILIINRSVSKSHAQITFSNGSFYLRDVKSKFGTLVQIQKDMKFGNQTVCIQVGRCHYQITPIASYIQQQMGNETYWGLLI